MSELVDDRRGYIDFRHRIAEAEAVIQEARALRAGVAETRKTRSLLRYYARVACTTGPVCIGGALDFVVVAPRRPTRGRRPAPREAGARNTVVNDGESQGRANLAAQPLPRTSVTQLRVGHGTGERCQACDDLVADGQVEYTMAIEDGTSLRFHRECVAVWHARPMRSRGTPQ